MLRPGDVFRFKDGMDVNLSVLAEGQSPSNKTSLTINFSEKFCKDYLGGDFIATHCFYQDTDYGLDIGRPSGWHVFAVSRTNIFIEVDFFEFKELVPIVNY